MVSSCSASWAKVNACLECCTAPIRSPFDASLWARTSSSIEWRIVARIGSFTATKGSLSTNSMRLRRDSTVLAKNWVSSSLASMCTSHAASCSSAWGPSPNRDLKWETQIVPAASRCSAGSSLAPPAHSPATGGSMATTPQCRTEKALVSVPLLARTAVLILGDQATKLKLGGSLYAPWTTVSDAHLLAWLRKYLKALPLIIRLPSSTSKSAS
mmetsp:Transcript_49389/g.107825  ORF Transcript_49389/g.107825 Transcript_49389/m.107825 type:complete len:213 (-) Transcript_49389:447-1085(-)